MVDQKAEIPLVEKVYYLLGAVEGEARNTVSKIPSMNYQLMIDTLRKNYGSQEDGAIHVAEKLLSLKKACGIKETLYTVEEIERLLSQDTMMNEAVNRKFVVTIVITKFPEKILESHRNPT